MADKDPSSVRIVLRKPRNPFVVAALIRRAGSHEKPGKAARQQSRQRFERAMGALLRGDRTELDVD